MDYQGNSRKEKEEKEVSPKVVEKVIVGEVVVQKKPLGRKIKELFVEADFRTVVRYVGGEVLLPAARNMIVDAFTKGVERMMYGERAMQRRGYPGGHRITYNNPLRRDYRDAPAYSPGLRAALPSRSARNDFVLQSKDEAVLVLERMHDIVDKYEVASVADLNDLVGFPTSHIDNKWGWVDLRGVEVRQVRDGYLIDFPPAEPIQ